MELLSKPNGQQLPIPTDPHSAETSKRKISAVSPSIHRKHDLASTDRSGGKPAHFFEPWAKRVAHDGPRFHKRTQKISADDRLFTAALIYDRSTNAIFKLIQSYRKKDIPSDGLLRAYRLYLSQHLTGPRCEDNVQLTGKEPPYYVKEINYFYPDTPFTPDEMKPTKVEAGPSSDEYFKSANARRLLEDFQVLRGYDDDDPINRESTTSAAWQEKMLEYLRKLEAWEGQAEATGIDYLNQKCNLYLALIKIVPPGEAIDQVLLSYIKLLSQESILRESRIEWLWHANDLFRFVQTRPRRERAKMLRVISNSKAPVMQAYAQLLNANLF